MSKRIIILVITLFVSANSLSLAQSPLGLSVTFGGGLLLPQSSNIKGNISGVYDYPLSKTNYSLSGKIRANIAVLPFSIVGSVSYNPLFDDAVLPVSTTSGTVNARYTHSLSVVIVGIGLEYALLSTPVASPYVSVGGAAGFLSGTSKYENNVVPESKLNSANRMGLELGLGTTFNPPFLPVALDVEVKYRMVNLFGKEFNSGGFAFSGFGGIPQTPTYNLNDAANPNDAQDHSRSINFLTISLGITIAVF